MGLALVVAAGRRPGGAGRGVDPGSWSQLGNLLDDDALDEKISVFRKVTRLAPSDADGFDSLACALVSAGHTDEALEVCKKAVIDGEVPFTLREREAWILYHAGKKEEAIQKMEGVVASNPQYH